MVKCLDKSLYANATPLLFIGKSAYWERSLLPVIVVVNACVVAPHLLS